MICSCTVALCMYIFGVDAGLLSSSGAKEMALAVKFVPHVGSSSIGSES